MKFSIIIPYKDTNRYLQETVGHVIRLNHPDWELLLVPNDSSDSHWEDDRVRTIPSGRVGPGAKRDMAARVAGGDVLVFLDDDSYPEPNLLDIASQHFADSKVIAIGGPAMTPPDEPFWQRVSGTVFLSRLAGGIPERYVPMGGVREVDDWPSVNLMVRRKEFLEVGGFDTEYWPGEDTKFCLDLVKRTGSRILYVPDLLVWHHRKKGLIGHLRQVGAYGLHRGFFAKKYPETSRRITYFLPSALVLFVLLTILVLVIPGPLRLVVAAGWVLYAFALIKAFFDFLRHERFSVALCALWFTLCTHLFYGVRFIQGLMFTGRLQSTLR